MRVDPYLQLSKSCDQLARRRLPWLSDERLEGLSVPEQVAAIRGHRSDHEASDRIIRALVGLGQDHPDAITVLIHALAGPLKSKLRHAATVDYVTDALSDLTLVIFDSIGKGEPDRLDHLARRYLARAHNRTWRTEHRARHHGTKTISVVDTYGPTDLAMVQDGLVTNDRDNVANVASDRADLARFVARVKAAIGDDSVSEQAWVAYRDHRLGRIFRPPSGPASAAQRAAALRAARMIEPIASRSLRILPYLGGEREAA